MSNGKIKVVILAVGLIKKISLYKMSYFPEPRTLNKNLVKKAEYNTRIAESEKKILDCNTDKYIITQEFKKLTAENLLQD